MLRVHLCFLDRECRSYGAPPRIYARLPRHTVIVALTRDAWVDNWVTIWERAQSSPRK